MLSVLKGSHLALFGLARHVFYWNPSSLAERTNSKVRDNIKFSAVCFLLGNTPASEFYMPTFRNTLFHLHRRIGMKVILHTYPSMKMEQSVPKCRHIKFRRGGNYPEESIQHSEHGGRLKSSSVLFTVQYCLQFSTVYSSALFTVQHCLQFSAVYSSALFTVQYCLQFSTVYSSVLFTVQYCLHATFRLLLLY